MKNIVILYVRTGKKKPCTIIKLLYSASFQRRMMSVTTTTTHNYASANYSNTLRLDFSGEEFTCLLLLHLNVLVAGGELQIPRTESPQ